MNNVLFLLNRSPQTWGTVDEYYVRLCTALADQGSQVVVAFANPVSADVRRRYESSGAVVDVLTYRKRGFFWGLRRLIREFDITFVHIRYFRLSHVISWIVFLHGIRAILYTDAEGGEADSHGLRRALKRLRIRLTTTPNTRMMAISTFVRDRLIESGVPERKICIVHNGVDLSRFSPAPDGRMKLADKYKIPADAMILCTISRLWRIKRVDVLLRACANIKNRGMAFRFLIAGKGPEEAALKALCTELGLDDEVLWLGYTGAPETLLRGSDVFLLATAGEAFGNVLVEAMGCGVPVVGSRSGAIPDIVPDGKCGLIAKPGDPESFADQILRLGADGQLRRTMGEQALARAGEFSVDRWVAETLQVYSSM